MALVEVICRFLLMGMLEGGCFIEFIESDHFGSSVVCDLREMGRVEPRGGMV